RLFLYLAGSFPEPPAQQVVFKTYKKEHETKVRNTFVSCFKNELTMEMQLYEIRSYTLLP
ncbi:hypothetical protein PMU66_12985, partial [Enterococcus durans]|uniref:hypothetical protein n=1 Tax=Enterococcus durans TaxID=53345 RepID=UPI00232D9FDF